MESKSKFMDQIMALESDAQRSTAFSYSEQIASRVARVREIKAERERLMVEAGIPLLDEETDALKAELREIARNYREVTGSNWADAEGYCRISVAGESHKYETPKVDEAAALMHSMIGELGELLSDAPIIVANIDGAKLTPAQYVEYASKHSIDSQELMSVLVMMQQYHQSQQEEALMRAEAMQKALQTLAAARSTSTTPEKLTVV